MFQFAPQVGNFALQRNHPADVGSHAALFLFEFVFDLALLLPDDVEQGFPQTSPPPELISKILALSTIIIKEFLERVESS